MAERKRPARRTGKVVRETRPEPDMTAADSGADPADEVVVDVSAAPADDQVVDVSAAPADDVVVDLPTETESPEAPPTDLAVVIGQLDAAEAGLASSDLTPVSEELKAIVEALIFASPEPLTLKALCKVLASEPKEDVQQALEALKLDYERPHGLQLIEIAGGMQIVTRTDLNEWVRRLFHERKTTKLSVQALETLAVIAYRQPVTSVEIAEIRGVNTSGVLATLMERKLVKIAGRKQVVGRPFLYATTREFLMRFGLNDLGDLPKVEDMADLLGFDLSTALAEPMPSDQLLPLEVSGDEAMDSASSPDEGEPAADSVPAVETGPSPEDLTPPADPLEAGEPDEETVH